MEESRKTCLMIQARMNSKRVPNKMTRDFAGDSLFRIALEKLTRLKEVPQESIFVCVGEEPLLQIASDFNHAIITRSQLSCDSTNSDKPDSLKLLYEWYEHMLRYGYTHVVLVSSCNPLLKPETIDKFWKEFEESGVDGMFSVTKKNNFYWDQFGETITDWKGMKLMNTRKIPPIYEGAHCIYGSRIDYIKDECWMGNTSPPKPKLAEVSDLEATDIDTLEDFEIAEVLYKHFIGEKSKEINKLVNE